MSEVVDFALIFLINLKYFNGHEACRAVCSYDNSPNYAPLARLTKITETDVIN